MLSSPSYHNENTKSKWLAANLLFNETSVAICRKTHYFLADRGYDSNEIVHYALAQNMTPVIPPRKNRKDQREYDAELYKIRHHIENAFLHIKRWRGIATRYAKNASSFLAAIQIRCLSLWFNIS